MVGRWPIAEELNVVTKMYDLLLYLLPQVERFPRSQKFTLGDRIASLSLDVLEALLEAQYRREKLPTLYEVNLRLEKLRYLIRLAKDFKILGIRRYEHIARQINEVGMLVGGWIKQQRGEQR